MITIQEQSIDDKIRLANKEFEAGLIAYEQNHFKECHEKMTTAHKFYLETNDTEKISICLTFIGLMKYLCDADTYKSSLLLMEDARFLAQEADGENAWGISKYAFSEIALRERNYHDALIYLNRAVYMVNKYPYILMRIYESLAYLNLKTKNYEKSYEFTAKAKELAETGNYDDAYKRITGIHKALNENSEAILTDSLKNIKRPDNADIPSDPLIALLKIARTISAEIDLDMLLKTMAEQTKFALKADRCTVFLIDKEKNELWSKVALGVDNHTEIRFSMDKGLAGHVAKTGETVNIPNAYNDDRFNPEIDAKTGYKTSNILCMPIRNLKYEVIGVFQVINKYDGSFTESDEDLLITIGAIAGIALENNRLFESQQKMLKEQKQLFNGFIDTLAASIDARDKITAGHSMRVTQYSILICNKLGLDKETTETISQAAMLHDIGKIGIRDSVLQKKGKLTPEEYKQIQEHVRITHDILSKIAAKSESFKSVVEIASSHHEKFDGHGYFRHKDGNHIPLGGRILAVADVFDAITSIRHYRDRMPIQDAVKIIKDGAGTHFDKRITDTFLSVSSDKIIDVIMFDTNSILDINSRKILEKYNLSDLESISLKEQKSDLENELINTFNKFYIQQIQGTED